MLPYPPPRTVRMTVLPMFCALVLTLSLRLGGLLVLCGSSASRAEERETTRLGFALSLALFTIRFRTDALRLTAFVDEALLDRVGEALITVVVWEVVVFLFLLRP